MSVTTFIKDLQTLKLTNAVQEVTKSNTLDLTNINMDNVDIATLDLPETLKANLDGGNLEFLGFPDSGKPEFHLESEVDILESIKDVFRFQCIPFKKFSVRSNHSGGAVLDQVIFIDTVRRTLLIEMIKFNGHPTVFEICADKAECIYHIGNLASTKIRFEGSDIVVFDLHSMETVLEALADGGQIDVSTVAEPMIQALGLAISSVVSCLSSLTYAMASNYHAFDTKPTSAKMKKLPVNTRWKFKNTSNIVFMKRVPEVAEGTNVKSHTDSSIKWLEPYERIGHKRTLTNERFKNHPRFGSWIWIKPAYVGPKEFILVGDRYEWIDLNVVSDISPADLHTIH